MGHALKLSAILLRLFLIVIAVFFTLTFGTSESHPENVQYETEIIQFEFCNSDSFVFRSPRVSCGRQLQL